MATLGRRLPRPALALLLLLLAACGFLVLPSLLGAADGGQRLDLRELLALSVAAAEAGGRRVRAVHEAGPDLQQRTKGQTQEGAEELLTAGDLQSHRCMASLWASTFPGIRVISEEHDEAALDLSEPWDGKIPLEIQEMVPSGQTVSMESVTVWIDPLDATQEYTEGLLSYVTTMVCVAVDGKPVIGVIHKPFTGFTAWALVGHGANVSARESYDERSPRLIVSRSHAGTVRTFSQKAFGTNVNIIPAGGAGYKVLSLLNLNKAEQPDQADAYLHITFIKKWDICAGNAVLSALGGHMTTLDGKDIDYLDSPGNKEGLIASVGLDHQELVKKVNGLEEQRLTFPAHMRRYCDAL
ncbi:inositol monophosphatase 3-like [Phascolarctos cinereus]|uniref:Golgi-resident adenosine 3',5'-bisphosphate 3'-phosphatase n=1 Tax=Phascolarctos cinereus TaxID=38626 RepID=A0A6P5JSP4_PHACI|nr:inositol monophosphatase 3-like [Phascolarctos cinereus]